jgi:FAD/FMN-containing dehydrogenase
LTCDHFINLELVTAEGDVIRANADENEDLFWALRGGGGNFGIVTRFECQLESIGEVQAGWICFPGEQAVDVLCGAREIGSEDKSGLRLNFVLGVPPELVGLESDDSVLGARIVYHGNADAAERTLAELRSLGTPIVDNIMSHNYVDIQTHQDTFSRQGIGWYMKSGHCHDLTVDLINIIVQQSRRHNSKRTLQIVNLMGGAIADVDELDSAYSGRDAEWHLAIEVGFTNEAERADIVGWTRETWHQMQPHMDMMTSYINMLVDPEVDRIEKAYGGPDKFQRLRTIKSKFDPDNFFQLNCNIPPL